MKTILWINNLATFSGGAEKYIHETATLLARQGFSNMLMAGIERPWDYKFTSPFEKAFPLDSTTLKTTVAALKPDLIYVHNVADIETINAIAATGIPSVRFFHDHSPFCPRDHKYFAITNHTCTVPMGFHCFRCLGIVKTGTGITGLGISTAASKEKVLQANRELTGFISGSQYMANLIVKHDFPAAATRAVPLFIVPPAVMPVVTRDDRKLVFAGTLVRGKGLDILIKALALLDPAVTLTVAGDGPQKDMFVECAAAAGVSERVTFTGWLSPDDLNMEIATSAIMVIPSREPETFCLTGLAAFAAGTPVIASDVGGITEWLKDGETGLLYAPPQDPAALAATIRCLVGEPELAGKFAENGLKSLTDKYTPQMHIQKLVSFFELMIKRHAEHRAKR
jgi:glycosyltransferase involved in cell wall biosynthesis